VGKRNLEEAISSFKDVTFEVNWKPFFLNPNTPEGGIPLLDYLTKKYGSGAAQGALSGTSHLSQAGAAVVSIHLLRNMKWLCLSICCDGRCRTP
jgi:predicted DsbA family dithiol-disulfide isomerase